MAQIVLFTWFEGPNGEDFGEDGPYESWAVVREEARLALEATPGIAKVWIYEGPSRFKAGDIDYRWCITREEGGN